MLHSLISFHWLDTERDAAVDWAQHYVLVPATLIQIAFIALALLALRLFGRPLAGVLEGRVRRLHPGASSQALLAVARIVPWLLLLLALWFGALAFHQAGRSTAILRLAESLALAWVVIRMTSNLVRDPKLAAFIAILAWVIAALNIVGWIDAVAGLLGSMAIEIGHTRLSLLLVLKGLVLLVTLIWVANTLSRLLEQRLQGLPRIAPAMQVLAVKLARATLVTLAIVVALSSIGIDLTAFAVFSGAIGVGVGFGLQKVVSNLVSGVILLLDRSIKPGDVIEIGGTYGWITRLNARFVSVSTRDGIEHLIPNEDLITQRVTNWSYTNDLVRLRVPVGIAYDSDVRLAMQLCVEAAKEATRALDTPGPVCLLKDFGGSSVDLELRFWIRDPQNGTANVRSEVLLGIWDRFRAHDITLPFPQRDLTIRNPEALAAAVVEALHRQVGQDKDAPGADRDGADAPTA
jgi:small-conductance mechanosensitive channel